MTEELTLSNLSITIEGEFTGYVELYNLNHSEKLLLYHFIEGLQKSIETVYGEYGIHD